MTVTKPSTESRATAVRTTARAHGDASSTGTRVRAGKIVANLLDRRPVRGGRCATARA